jgi:Holliday junction resolvase
MDILKSTRHSKIAGDFGELLFLYWLSKSGFEVALVDHIGIDLVAFSKRKQERIGISVKTRTRLPGKEKEGIYIKKDEIEKITNSCIFFGCKPYFGIAVDRNKSIQAFLISMENLFKINGVGQTFVNVKVAPEYLTMYRKTGFFITLTYSEEGEI